MTDLIHLEKVAEQIHTVRGIRVMLDRDLATLYGVETKALKQAVRRNIERFPDDFMFQMTMDEEKSLRSQTVTLKRGAHSKYPPFAFTEQGVAMLSTVLHSERAIQVNIQIIRVFTKMRQMLIDHEELRQEMQELRQQTDDRFQIVFETLDKLLACDDKPKNRIGFF